MISLSESPGDPDDGDQSVTQSVRPRVSHSARATLRRCKRNAVPTSTPPTRSWSNSRLSTQVYTPIGRHGVGPLGNRIFFLKFGGRLSAGEFVEKSRFRLEESQRFDHPHGRGLFCFSRNGKNGPLE